ncbi:MAG: hypothetical protein KUG77_13430 [Nannocystaceae bacterium]|nr:hypothetical protein [Nannocystaceae bacterium]
MKTLGVLEAKLSKRAILLAFAALAQFGCDVLEEPLVGRAGSVFCADQPEALDCIDRCEDDATLDGCWFQCEDGEEVDCWAPEPEVPSCGPLFCAENPDGLDCIDRCEDDPAVDGCWYECEGGQDVDCWTLEAECDEPSDSVDPEPEVPSCGPLFCAENPDGVDCIDRCEDDPAVDGCWYECVEGQDVDCWSYEAECDEPSDPAEPECTTGGPDEPVDEPEPVE